MGRTDYEGGFYEEAKICFDESSEFAENELPPNHEHFVNMYYHMGLTLLMQGQSSDAKYAFKQALTLSKEIKNKSHDLVIRVFLIGGALQSINGMPEDAIENYRGGLALLRKYSPGNQEMIANIMAMIGTEYMLTTKKESAIEWLLEAVQLMKNSVGSTHLTVADALRNIATLEDSIGNVSNLSAFFRLDLLFGLILIILIQNHLSKPLRCRSARRSCRILGRGN